MAGPLTETEARRALAMAPLRWRGWAFVPLLAFVAFPPAFFAGALEDSVWAGVAVATGFAVVGGIPICVLALRGRAKVKAENEIHELVEGASRPARASDGSRGGSSSTSRTADRRGSPPPGRSRWAGPRPERSCGSPTPRPDGVPVSSSTGAGATPRSSSR